MIRPALVGTSLIVLFLVIGVGVFFASGAVAGSSDVVTLSIEVFDDDGTPVHGADVTIEYDGDSQSATTLSNGKAFFDVPVGSDVTAHLEDDTLVRNHPVDIGEISAHHDATVVMYSPGTATVEVVDEDGDVVQGASVELTKVGDSDPAARGTTDASGELVVSGIEQGNYEVVASEEGHYDAETSIDVGETSTTVVTLEAGTVTVKFEAFDTHFEDAKPLDARVTVKRDGQEIASVRTGASGTGALELEVNTEYTFVVEKDGHDTLERTTTLGERDRVVNLSMERSAALEVTPSNERIVLEESVLVAVTDEYDQPVADADVLLDGELITTTDQTGSARVPIEETGELSIVAEIDGISSEPAIVEGVMIDDETGEIIDDFDDEADDSDDESAGEDQEELPGFAAVAGLLALAVAVTVLVHRSTRSQSV